jgi:alpha-tubulin suppressor-like RCC1 family protein
LGQKLIWQDFIGHFYRVLSIINCILGLGDDVLQVKKPRKIPLFSLGPGFPANQIIKIACGG